MFAADFTRFAKKERDLVPISLTGSIFAIVTYIFGALIVYYGFEQSFAYFSAQGMDATLAANAAVTNPGALARTRLRWPLALPTSACRR